MLKTILFFLFIISVLSCSQSANKEVSNANSLKISTSDALYASKGPYKDSAINLIYNLLFCDNIELYRATGPKAPTYPFGILFSDTSTIGTLEKIADDSLSDVRMRLLAYERMRAKGYKANKKELLAVIVEIGFDEGLDVLASFNNGTARYINQTGKLLVLERTTDKNSNQLTKDLFSKGKVIIDQIGVWDKPRRPAPAKGNVRITFLASNGLYFGEGPADVLFNDSVAGPLLNSAALLMKYLMEKSLSDK